MLSAITHLHSALKRNNTIKQNTHTGGDGKNEPPPPLPTRPFMRYKRSGTKVKPQKTNIKFLKMIKEAKANENRL